MPHRLHLRRTISLWVLLTAVPLPFGLAQERPWVFGVLNQQSAARTAERWNPVLQYLSDTTGQRFELRMGATVKDTNAMMGRGEFDFAFTNHNFRREFDGVYRVIARLSGPPIYGVIAVNADSPITQLHELAGRRVGFPSREAFVAYAVPVQALLAAKVTVVPVMAGNQDGALAQLKARQVEAVGVNSRFLSQYAARHGLNYREVFTSAGYADIPVVAHPRVNERTASAVRQALAGMRGDPKGAALLESAGFEGFETASEADYANVRKAYRAVE
jgi:phosphonate transport system substrate-binding protein